MNEKKVKPEQVAEIRQKKLLSRPNNGEANPLISGLIF